MKLSGPERYELTWEKPASSATVVLPVEKPKFSGIATSMKPKLYIASVDEKPFYVGVTRQPLRNRLSLGWRARGRAGFWGYAWRHHLCKAFLDVWCDEDPPARDGDPPMLAVETLEAEVVFLIRRKGQWPEHQTEIHFHPSSEIHRNVAEAVVARYAF